MRWGQPTIVALPDPTEWALVRWCHELVDRLDQWVTARADVRAREMGLEITRIPGTRIQVYAYPRRRHRCPADDRAASSALPGGERR